MSHPRSPRLLKAGLILLDPDTTQVRRTIALQYNPETLTRSLEVRSTGGDSADRSEPLRITAPPVETLRFEAEIDATDQLEHPDRNRPAVEAGIQPQLAALETMVYPSSERLIENDRLAAAGTLEILPMEASLTLFVWSKSRVLPVRLTEFSVTEEFFDPALNPIRARVGIGLRVLSVSDVGFAHKAGSLFIAYQQQKERLAKRSPNAGLSALGLSGLP